MKRREANEINLLKVARGELLLAQRILEMCQSDFSQIFEDINAAIIYLDHYIKMSIETDEEVTKRFDITAIQERLQQASQKVSSISHRKTV
jgi:hypothetical protein